ncbi:uncharacterized protein BDR25DRAFT_58050 [Lindgomyces ingoldianus]|uniref:Uncharacterized protein n=1 Tax=Lindgomyces ingoldianus TaxID=673940 RepID=A0ACB6QME0_9PLEO|nr:uncharacterized protein BDR25DRAFT_58050 [Lindgomyces ingoldianus]KAF2468144.1 hypothetical protein BDR25DRAFT_58050 [Lindgomyces ingoldianus]
MTTTYNVYKVYFSQASGPSHVGIALVPAQLIDQGRGRFYHVKGNVGMGMDYESRPAYNFARSKSYEKSECVCQLPKSNLEKFEEIAASQPPPHDERVFFEKNPDPPAPDCATWVDEVMAQVQQLS